MKKGNPPRHKGNLPPHRDRKKTNNHPSSLRAKVEIRENVLKAVGEDNASVFDAFSGEGQLYKLVWHRAKNYVGCDRVWYRDERLLFVADNKTIMRTIDLTAFNIIDLDAYGSPWHNVLILAARRRLAAGERIGVVLTEGCETMARHNTLGRDVQEIAGLHFKHARGGARGASAFYDDIFEQALIGMCRRMDCRVVKRWQARGPSPAMMRYVGLVLEQRANQS